MTHSILDLLRNAVVHYGYWAVGVALLLENAGVPVPGETILLLASFLAFSEHELQLPWIILVATIAATLGDNLGFALGYYGGRPLLVRYQSIFRIQDKTLTRGENLFARYGPATVFFARFVFGMRIIAGPMAGVLAHALAEISGLQLSGRRGVGDGDLRSGLSIRPALDAAGTGFETA